MKILFADKFPEPQLKQLQDQGHHCDLQPDVVGDALPDAVGDAEILVVRSTKVSAQAIDAAASLRLVVRAGAGTNTIDKEAAANRNIPVCNVPGKNAVAVAELTIGLLIAIDRRIPENVIDLKARRWNKKKYSVAQGLYGRHMGIIGLGAIGLAVAERARAFGIHVYVVDKPSRSTQTRETLARLGLETVPDLDTLLGTCDIISLHVPSAAETKGLVNTEFLEKLQPDTIIINASREDVIDEDALLSAMSDKGIRAGLDVFADEPASGEGTFSSALASHPNTCGTHHIGASTNQAQTAVAEGVLEVIDAFEGGTVLHCVNGQG